MNGWSASRSVRPSVAGGEFARKTQRATSNRTLLTITLIGQLLQRIDSNYLNEPLLVVVQHEPVMHSRGVSGADGNRNT